MRKFAFRLCYDKWFVLNRVSLKNIEREICEKINNNDEINFNKYSINYVKILNWKL